MTSSPATSDPSRRLPLWAGIAGVVLLGGVLTLFYWSRDSGWVEEVESAEEVVAKSFDGDSAKLSQTQIVPTLDTPLAEGKSVVWCSSFQLAWNELKQDVIKGPVRIRNAEETADRLNQSKQSKDDLEPDSYYAAAGLVKDGIVERIRDDMARRFPNTLTPALDSPPEAALSYAYLKAGVRYEHTFFNNTERLLFKDSSGKETAIASFGITDRERSKDGGGNSFRGQVAVLWHKGDEFAVDLSKRSSPNQIILVRMRRGTTLAEMLDTHHRQPSPGEYGSVLQFEDTLLVPVMHWRVEHRFRELEGKDKTLQRSGWEGVYLSKALQMIEFKMDRRGAEVASEVMIGFDNGGPQRFHFDRPFLILMKKRNAVHPFFVMWVDNAELLSR